MFGNQAQAICYPRHMEAFDVSQDVIAAFALGFMAGELRDTPINMDMPPSVSQYHWQVTCAGRGKLGTYHCRTVCTAWDQLH